MGVAGTIPAIRGVYSPQCCSVGSTVDSGVLQRTYSDRQSPPRFYWPVWRLVHEHCIHPFGSLLGPVLLGKKGTRGASPSHSLPSIFTTSTQLHKTGPITAAHYHPPLIKACHCHGLVDFICCNCSLVGAVALQLRPLARLAKTSDLYVPLRTRTRFRFLSLATYNRNHLFLLLLLFLFLFLL
jgi:hypothetical protein